MNRMVGIIPFLKPDGQKRATEGVLLKEKAAVTALRRQACSVPVLL